MDYLGKVEVLTYTDLDRFVNNICEKQAFCAQRKVLDFWVQLMKNGSVYVYLNIQIYRYKD